MGARRQLIALAVLCAATLCLAAEAGALDRCKLTQDRQTGVLEVKAKEVAGALRFGFTPENSFSSFFNASECVADGAARGCQLADPATAEARVPPPMCEVYLRDDDSECVATLKRCTPGARPVCPPDMERLGGDCIEKSVSGGLEFSNAIQSCGARGRSLCSLPQLQRCDSLQLANDRPASCGQQTDAGAGVRLWTSSSLPIDGVSAYAHLTVYAGDNEIVHVPSNLGSIYDYFCCAPLGAQ